MKDTRLPVAPAARLAEVPPPPQEDEPVPPPGRERRLVYLQVHAVQLILLLDLRRLAEWVVAQRPVVVNGLPAGTRGRGRPAVYSDGTVLLVALVARTWQLSERRMCAWLEAWPALARAVGMAPDRIIDPAHFNRRVRALGVFPLWLLFLCLVGQAIRVGLLAGRDVVLDSTLLRAWSSADPDATWWRPASRGGTFGYKVHLLLDRVARLPIAFLITPANVHDGPLAWPLLWMAWGLWRLPIHIVRADGAYYSQRLVTVIVTILRARPIIVFNRRKQPIERVRVLVWYRLSYGLRAIIERFFAAAKRYYGLDTHYMIGWNAVCRRVMLTQVAILLVGLTAHHLGHPELRLSPTRVLAGFSPVDHPR